MNQGTCLKGKVGKIKILKLEEQPLVRFTLNTSEESRENCVIRTHSLNFLFHVNEGNSIVVFGKRNGRNQIVVRKYHVNQA